MYLAIGAFAELLGVSISTLRRWDKEGVLTPKARTHGNHRRYAYKQFLEFSHREETSIQDRRIDIAYARVSSADQREDLKRQEKVLEEYCMSDGRDIELISDLGSGLNYKKRGLKKLIKYIMTGKVRRVILTHKDRLLRFGSEIIFYICSFFKTDIVLIHEEEQISDDTRLAKDVLEILTVFSAKLYGRRAHRHKKSDPDLVSRS